MVGFEYTFFFFNRSVLLKSVGPFGSFIEGSIGFWFKGSNRARKFTS